MNRTILKHIEIASRNGESPFMFESDNKRYLMILKTIKINAGLQIEIIGCNTRDELCILLQKKLIGGNTNDVFLDFVCKCLESIGLQIQWELMPVE